MPAAAYSPEFVKWASLAALVVQNSSLFVVTRFTRIPDQDGGPMYVSSVVVLVVELCKMLWCLAVLSSNGISQLMDALKLHVWEERSETLRLAVPAVCYALQNNLGVRLPT